MLPKILIEATILTGTIEISKMNTRNILKTTNKTFSYICCFSVPNIMENYFTWLFITIDEPIFAYSNSFKLSVWAFSKIFHHVDHSEVPLPSSSTAFSHFH
jgi:hypothetical protein